MKYTFCPFPHFEGEVSFSLFCKPNRTETDTLTKSPFVLEPNCIWVNKRKGSTAHLFKEIYL